MEGNMAEALDAIREGGQYMAMVAQERLNAASEALAAGDIDAAAQRTREAMQKLDTLAAAHGGLGEYGRDKRIVRAADLQEGMELNGWGKLVTKEANEQADGDTMFCLQFEDHGPKHVMAEQELIILVGAIRPD